jgi:hypothetical protein
MAKIAERRRYERRIVNELTDVEAAWLAAIIDGEGCITYENPNWQGDGKVYVYVRVQVANTCLALLERVEEITNVGRVNTRSNRAAHHTTCYVWTVGGDRAKEILRRVMPYLIVKAEVAEKAVMS